MSRLGPGSGGSGGAKIEGFHEMDDHVSVLQEPSSVLEVQVGAVNVEPLEPDGEHDMDRGIGPTLVGYKHLREPDVDMDNPFNHVHLPGTVGVDHSVVASSRLDDVLQAASVFDYPPPPIPPLAPVHHPTTSRTCVVNGCHRPLPKRARRLCEFHMPKRKLCATEGCSKVARNPTSYCVAHGTRQLKSCAYEGCSTTFLPNAGQKFCSDHQHPGDKAKKRLKSSSPKVCIVADCSNVLTGRGARKFCKEHKPTRQKQCSVENCNKYALRGGQCVSHGGGLRCQYIGGCKHATMDSQTKLCVRHGGRKKCRDCFRRSAANSKYCTLHIASHALGSLKGHEGDLDGSDRVPLSPGKVSKPKKGTKMFNGAKGPT